MESSISNNKSLGKFINKLSEILIDRGILAFYLLSALSKITNQEFTSQFRLVKDLKSDRFKDLLRNETNTNHFI